MAKAELHQRAFPFHIDGNVEMGDIGGFNQAFDCQLVVAQSFDLALFRRDAAVGRKVDPYSRLGCLLRASDREPGWVPAVAA